jgi:hypothetical protein
VFATASVVGSGNCISPTAVPWARVVVRPWGKRRKLLHTLPGALRTLLAFSGPSTKVACTKSSAERPGPQRKSSFLRSRKLSSSQTFPLARPSILLPVRMRPFYSEISASLTWQ